MSAATAASEAVGSDREKSGETEGQEVVAAAAASWEPLESAASARHVATMRESNATRATTMSSGWGTPGGRRDETATVINTAAPGANCQK